MSEITDLHDEAMEYMDRAFFARRNGNENAARQFLAQAYELERTAASLLRDNYDAEPSRSILYRSAATLALQCEKGLEAEKLASAALAGNAPPEIARELRDLIERINFDRHLELNGIVLQEDEVQLSISGQATAHGMAFLNDFIQRVDAFQLIIHRTAERLGGNTFRTRGAPPRSIKEPYQILVSAPGVGSINVLLRIGRQKQFEEFDVTPQVLKEIAEGFDLVNQDKLEELRERIPGEDYYRNFVGLARQMAPDGDAVKLVGLTFKPGDGPIQTARLTRTKKEIGTKKPVDGSDPTKRGAKDRSITVTGRLLMASAKNTEHKIELIDEDSVAHPIIVPEGLLDVVVGSLWNQDVVVTGQKKYKKIYLEAIDPA